MPGTSTHEVTAVGDLVVKRFRTHARGEHEREWRGLLLLDQHAPGLAPARSPAISPTIRPRSR